MMNMIAIIPARSGSKGVEDKNIRELCGKPLMAYTIEAAIKSGMFAEVMVSTDSEKYAEIAKKYGAKVPFLRNQETASDTASSWDVVYEVLKRYEVMGKEYEFFMLLQPTSPLRNENDIQGAVFEFKKKNANTIVSVCETEHSPIYANVLPDSLSMDDFFGNYKWARRQDLPKYYRLNGAIYMSNTAFFMKYMDIYKDKCFAYIMDNTRSIDIDTELDYLYTETILKGMGE